MPRLPGLRFDNHGRLPVVNLTAGRGRAVVVATGLRTEVGKIAKMTASAEDPMTPLELRLHQFGQWLVAMAVVLFALILAFGLWRGIAFDSIFMVAISQMVSMVPEGLPVAMTIALAVGIAVAGIVAGASDLLKLNLPLM